jgi:hypothetical protein
MILARGGSRFEMEDVDSDDTKSAATLIQRREIWRWCWDRRRRRIRRHSRSCFPT